MKRLVTIAAVLFMGCNSSTEQVNVNEYAKLDSIVAKSEKNLEIANGANKRSDSLVTGKVEKTVKKIKKMETEIKELKAENNELKNQLNSVDVDDSEPFILRTISDDQNN